MERVLRNYGPVLFVMQAGLGHHALLLYGVQHEESLGPTFSSLQVMDPERGMDSISMQSLWRRLDRHVGNLQALASIRRRSEPRLRAAGT